MVKGKFQEGKSIDRRKKHGRCRFDIKQPTGRFCTYWNQKLDDKTCHKCESKE